MSSWEDITSYRRDEERVPRWWRINLGRLRLCVGNSHVYYQDDPHWLMTVDGGSPRELGRVGDLTEADAKAAALESVRLDLERSLAAVMDAQTPTEEARDAK